MDGSRVPDHFATVGTNNWVLTHIRIFSPVWPHPLALLHPHCMAPSHFALRPPVWPLLLTGPGRVSEDIADVLLFIALVLNTHLSSKN